MLEKLVLACQVITLVTPGEMFALIIITFFTSSSSFNTLTKSDFSVIFLFTFHSQDRVEYEKRVMMQAKKYVPKENMFGGQQ